MSLTAAVVREQGVEFAVVIVKPHVIQNQYEASEAIAAFSPLFDHRPVVLMAQDARGTPTYRGRRDIVNFLANIAFQRLPWKKYQVS